MKDLWEKWKQNRALFNARFNIEQSIKNVNISNKYEELFACHFSTAANATRIASVSTLSHSHSSNDEFIVLALDGKKN